ncbi:ComEC/Rec2 family competence protein [Psychrobacillus sp. FSL W7-1457]|uniref:ComEC/Rec2 family competence protein n=1 Tax=unclassified Psychrobacillus TaxID=2636677 RepID=UPI0030F97922
MILFNKFMKIFIVLLLFVGLGFSNQLTAEAAPVMWGKTELKLGQIGKVTILKETKLVKIENNSLKEVRTLTKGEEFRVYSYKSEQGGLYGVGGGSFIQKNTATVKYETPSKSKLALLEQQTTSPSNATKVMWGKTELKKGQIGKATIIDDTKLVKFENGSLSTVRNLKKGEEFRVYTYKSDQGGLYGVGGGSFVQKSSKVKYETPSKSKLAQLEALSLKEMKVHFIDVGQGDSILIQSPNGKSMLIDGGTKSKGDTVVKFIKSQGITKLDFVVATHPDADHIGGLIKVLESNIKIGTFMDSGKVHTSNTYKDMLTLIRNKNINFKIPTKGEKITFDNLNLQVLNVGTTNSDNNDASIVLKLAYNNISFLLTGDADTGKESEIMSKYNVKSTILKAGHHGSDTSSSEAFLKAVKPEVTILSYGKNNQYGHPHKAVVDRLNLFKSSIYHTLSGTITVKTNGTSYSVSQ